MQPKATVDGKPVAGKVTTEHARRWKWLPRWTPRWLTFLWVEYQVYQLDAAPPKGSSVVIVYETNFEEEHGTQR